MRTSRDVLKGLVSAFACVCMAAHLAPTAHGDVLFYPTAARTLPNGYDGASWRLSAKAFLEKHADGVRFAKGTGGPFSKSDVTYSVVSTKPQPGYWHARVKARPGRVYLAGAWFRFSNAKLLLWYGGNDAETGKAVEERLYYMSGFNPQLRPYFNETLLKRLGGDPAKWRCLYRLVSFPAKLREDVVSVEHGLYLAAGDTLFSEPFFVDVTDGPRTLDVDIRNARPIRSLSVASTDLRDVRWSRTFDPPVTEFSCTLPPEIDAFRGQEGDRPKGHALTVRYADGSVETVGAPLDNVFKRRQ